MRSPLLFLYHTSCIHTISYKLREPHHTNLDMPVDIPSAHKPVLIYHIAYYLSLCPQHLEKLSPLLGHLPYPGMYFLDNNMPPLIDLESHSPHNTELLI